MVHFLYSLELNSTQSKTQISRILLISLFWVRHKKSKYVGFGENKIEYGISMNIIIGVNALNIVSNIQNWMEIVLAECFNFS
jgi:hypothetical protein